MFGPTALGGQALGDLTSAKLVCTHSEGVDSVAMSGTMV